MLPLRSRLRGVMLVQLAALVVWAMPSQCVLAQADINNGLTRLGVNPLGSLGITSNINPPVASAGPGSVSYLTLRYLPTNGEADSGGVREERWGVADALSAQFGGSTGGVNTNLTAGTFTSTATSAVATVTAGGIFQVTHDFHPSAHPNVYEITITIQNTSAAAVNLRYRRAFQWDIEPTQFQEFLTLQGSAQPGVLSFTDMGNAAVNPLQAPPGTSGDVVNKGPGPVNSGFTLTLDLGTLPAGGSTVFRMYYGATADRAAALTALTSLGIAVYAIGHPNTLPLNSGNPNTFFLGYSSAPPPPPLPSPTGPSPPGEGSFPGSSSGHAGQGEGGYGFGARSRALPVLLGPYAGKEAASLTVYHAPPHTPDGAAVASASAGADDILALAWAGMAALALGLAIAFARW